MKDTQFYKKETVEFRHKHVRFKFPSDDQIKDLDKIETKPFKITGDGRFWACLYKGEYHKETKKPYGRGLRIDMMGGFHEGCFDGINTVGYGRYITQLWSATGHFDGSENLDIVNKLYYEFRFPNTEAVLCGCRYR